MKRLNMHASLILAAVMVAVPSVNGQVVQVLGVGSSAQWKTAAIGAFLDLAGGVGHGHHWTKKDKTTAGNNFAQIHDSRSSAIPNEGGNVWVVWTNDHTKVWAYISVDSVVGNRAYFANPRAQLQLDPSVTTTAGQNLIAANLFGGQADELALPGDIFNALNNAPVTAAFTDIRPEDAKLAQCRAASTLNAVNYSGLGYGTTSAATCTTTPTLVGTAILSNLSTAKATPVAFNLSGRDPFTGNTIPASTTVPIGAAPIMVIINRQDASGLGASGVFKNISLANLQKIYTGAECDTNAFAAAGAPPNKAIVVLNREPLSGTFNTFEFTNMRLTANSFKSTQELNVNPAAAGGNPLNIACTTVNGVAGTRERGVGTGEIVSRGIAAIQNSIGYIFFSYGNVSPIAGSTSFGYLTLDGIDPIQSAYTNGVMPTCNEPCPAAGGSTFPNVRNGTYRSWSVLRVATDASGTNNTNVHGLVTAAQAHVNLTDPDFIPFLAQGVQNGGNEPGFQKYRSHFLQSGVSPSNGLPNGIGTEAGGDMGGCIESNGNPPGVLSCRQ
jgi:ABC-type phosphate transport system substrate-binding protein